MRDPQVAARAALDVTAWNQLGCLSPHVIYVEERGAVSPEGFAEFLAEALAEQMHGRVRREFWGYAPDEKAAIPLILREKYQGIRPAIGYPACPEHSEKENLFKLLNATEVGIELTEHFAMYPNASVSGQFFS